MCKNTKIEVAVDNQTNFYIQFAPKRNFIQKNIYRGY